MEAKLTRLLADFAWDRIDRVHDLTPAHHPSWRPTPR
jgi:hypothetical protein